MGARRWTDEEIDLLRSEYATRTRAELCALLNRSGKTITMKALKLGLRKGPATRSTSKAAYWRKWREEHDLPPKPAIPPAQAPAEATAPAELPMLFVVMPEAAPAPRQTPQPPEHQAAHRKRVNKLAARQLVDHGVDERAAELAVHLIGKRLIASMRIEYGEGTP